MDPGDFKEPADLLDALVIGTILNASGEEVLKTVPEEKIRALREKVAALLVERHAVSKEKGVASNLLPLIRPSTRPTTKKRTEPVDRAHTRLVARRRHDQKLADLNQTCARYLIRKFSELDILPWWGETSIGTKGGATFFLYDPIMTCLRLLPASPKIFQASVRSGIITESSAVQLHHELMATMRLLLDRYSGYFAAELRGGYVGQSLAKFLLDQDASSSERFTVLDEMAAAMPWPFLPSVHLRRGKLTPCGIQPEYLAAGGEDLMRSITMALDLASLGPSCGLSPEFVTAIIRALRGGKKGVIGADLAKGRDESSDLERS